MENRKKQEGLPITRPLEQATETPCCPCPSGVTEKEFPRIGTCFLKTTATTAPDGGCQALCPRCSIWTSLPEGAALKVTRIFDCLAKWTINTYTVTFESSGGSTVPSQTVPYNAVATEPPAPTRTNYTFQGWYSDSRLSTEFDFSTP